MKNIIIDGLQINSAKEVHLQLAKELDFGPYYGKNTDALWDVLTGDVERPFTITWINANESRARFGHDFDILVSVFNRVEEFDRQAPWPEKFSFVLED